MGEELLADELSNNKNQFNLNIDILFKANFSKWLSLNIRPQIIMQSGYIQSVDVVDPNRSRINLLNASVTLKPLESLQFTVGDLNQSEYHSALLLSDRAFPAVRSLVQYKSTQTELGVFVESAIPTSQTVSNNSNDLEKTPSLLMAQAFFNLKNSIEWSNRVGYFKYDNLPISISSASTQLGNSGIALSGTDYLFKYQFEGFEAQTKLNIPLSNALNFKVDLSAVQNSKAPTLNNLGWKAATGVDYFASKKITLCPSIQYFRIEEDAVVSIYNSNLFNTNRQGYLASLETRYNGSVSLTLSAGERAALYDHGSMQTREKYFSMMLETQDAKL
jgi:hypothetical protein